MIEPGEQVRPPEVPFNTTLIKCLKSVDTALVSKGISPFVISPQGIDVKNEGKNLVTVTGDDIKIAGRSFQDKLVDSSPASETSDASQRLTRLLGAVSGNLVRLNHLGVSYYADDIEEEARRVSELAGSSNTPLNEEKSPDPNEKWLFMGNTENVEDPLAEIVLNKKGNPDFDFWKPHFQIDIDTRLTFEQIKALTEEHLEKDFIKWKLDIPGYGTVLTMGILGEIGGTKIALGIGTNLRGTQHHRKNELKPVVI